MRYNEHWQTADTHWTKELHLTIQQWKGTEHACGVAILFNERFNFDLEQLKRDSHGCILAAKISVDDRIFNLMFMHHGQTLTAVKSTLKWQIICCPTTLLLETLIQATIHAWIHLGETPTQDIMQIKYVAKSCHASTY